MMPMMFGHEGVRFGQINTDVTEFQGRLLFCYGVFVVQYSKRRYRGVGSNTGFASGIAPTSFPFAIALSAQEETIVALSSPLNQIGHLHHVPDCSGHNRSSKMNPTRHIGAGGQRLTY
jgi:hypothetical protein